MGWDGNFIEGGKVFFSYDTPLVFFFSIGVEGERFISSTYTSI